MSFLRFLPKRMQRRIKDYAPRGFPDAASCGAFYDARARLFRNDEATVLEYSSRDVQRQLFARAVEALPPRGRILDVGNRTEVAADRLRKDCVCQSHSTQRR